MPRTQKRARHCCGRITGRGPVCESQVERLSLTGRTSGASQVRLVHILGLSRGWQSDGLIAVTRKLLVLLLREQSRGWVELKFFKRLIAASSCEHLAWVVGHEVEVRAVVNVRVRRLHEVDDGLQLTLFCESSRQPLPIRNADHHSRRVGVRRRLGGQRGGLSAPRLPPVRLGQLVLQLLSLRALQLLLPRLRLPRLPLLLLCLRRLARLVLRQRARVLLLLLLAQLPLERTLVQLRSRGDEHRLVPMEHSREMRDHVLLVRHQRPLNHG
mmetsp:Transcript_36787/g.84305  ORF Transcript_36787/g.84305 Transcript_36787/m.84305 type:complete len:270 (-) Transcript_36787:715-1524(-)